MTAVRLGGLSIRQVVELDIRLPFGDILPGIAADDLETLGRWYRDDALASDPAEAECLLSMHTYVVEVDGKIILIDTCNGNHKNRSLPFIHQLDTPWLTRIRELGIEPEDVDIVLFTHLHVDHVGWNTRLEGGRWVPTFPNARYVMNRRDLDHFSVAGPDVFNHEAYRDSVAPILGAGLADIVEADAVVHGARGDGIWLQPAYGHTPGNCTVHACRGGPTAVFAGDILHHPIQLVRPDLQTSFDDDGELAARVRAEFLAEYADSGAVVFPAHFPLGGGGMILRAGDGYRFQFLGSRGDPANGNL